MVEFFLANFRTHLHKTMVCCISYFLTALLVWADLKTPCKAALNFVNFLIFSADDVLYAFQVYHYLQLLGFFSMGEGNILFWMHIALMNDIFTTENMELFLTLFNGCCVPTLVNSTSGPPLTENYRIMLCNNNFTSNTRICSSCFVRLQYIAHCILACRSSL